MTFNNFSLVVRSLSVMEKRHVRRRRVFKAAIIEFPGGVFSCVVRDLSDCGANLDVPSQIGIPYEFMLSIPTAQLHRPCRAVWRSDKRVGIAFVKNERQFEGNEDDLAKFSQEPSS
ncbi:PilZ domain-containing protein [Bradyrhizobium arachidis]|uniref:PilZ domain-containing protein n=1 Tax=Bradyrhizobium TaxID=374 RepID=UPI00188CE6F8|nr:MULTISPECIES: PilZ domain-containing protein [Bradyrhizobium]MDN4983954.1 PilZ domain-containing protein [Bradyrhizobium sp. WYCCWR 13022]QOZ51863.1 PilZ domain-containing protein [Bradyrhizobium sp. CCBAU 53338]UVO39037.1 PilZ domain-containing protein [Bradyrhizobium arachidis]